MSAHEQPMAATLDATPDVGVDAVVDAVATLELQPDPAAVRHARAFVATRCTAGGASPDTSDTAVLLTSEVVTNTVLHGRSQTRLSITVNPDAIRVEVSDDNSRHPTLAPPDEAALDGRGMTMVNLLATTWGVRDEGLGKTVWFTLANS